MFILNTTYITTRNNIDSWKKWLKDEAFLESSTFRKPDFTVYRIGETAEEDQASFAVQFQFENMTMLNLFEEELALIHENSLAKKFGAQCLFFTTVLSHEKI
ncbi:MAG TPA: DUF4286 family protein [Cytophagaceae bacterium]|jgi:hypothetical protein|nr:DUF4286 family protein [Cytophagaceae bacterium]